MGGTSFRKANLTDANFTQATLSSHSTTFVTAYYFCESDAIQEFSKVREISEFK
jgi:uncharacterized protein YjbI with pentapeptide repeats